MDAGIYGFMQTIYDFVNYYLFDGIGNTGDFAELLDSDTVRICDWVIVFLVVFLTCLLVFFAFKLFISFIKYLIQ